MNKKILLSAIGGSVVSFLLGWLVYGMAGMDSFMKSHMTHYEGLERGMDMQFMVMVFLSGFVSSWLYAYLISRMGISGDFMSGLKFGAIVSIGIGLSYDLYFLGALNLYSNTAVVADVVIGAVMGGIMAGTIAWMQGRLGGSPA